MVPFVFFLESTDPGLCFCGFYSLVAPVVEAGEFFLNRAWGRVGGVWARTVHPKNGRAEGFWAVWANRRGYGTTALGTFKACLRRLPVRF